MVADMEVHMVADMEVDRVADIAAEKKWAKMEMDMVADMEVDKLVDMVANMVVDEVAYRTNNNIFGKLRTAQYCKCCKEECEYTESESINT